MDPAKIKSLGIQYHSVSRSTLLNYQLEFNVLLDECFRFETCGMPNIMPSFGSTIEGVLYELDDADITALDHDAGVSSMKYYRKLVEIKSSNGMIKAVSYAAWPDMTSQGLSPSQKHLNQIIDAAVQAGTSQKYIQWLRSHSRELVFQ
jgi:hypothetical protein